MKRSKLSLVALILGLLALSIMASALFTTEGGSEAQQAGEAIGKLIVLPCAAMTLVAVVLNLLGYTMNNSTLTLISAIFYTVALVIMPLWGFVTIPSMIMQYIAYPKIKKQRN